MREGRIVQAGTLDEVWRQPADGWTAAVPRLRDRAHRRARRARLRELVAPGHAWQAVALRRSALRVDPAGPADRPGRGGAGDPRPDPGAARRRRGRLPARRRRPRERRTGGCAGACVHRHVADRARPRTTARWANPRMTPCEAARLCSNGDDRRGHGPAGLHHRPGARLSRCATPTASSARRGCGCPLLCIGAFVADIVPRTLWRSRGRLEPVQDRGPAAHPRALDAGADHAGRPRARSAST